MVKCSYHLCNRKDAKKKCRYCQKYFCDEHIRAKPPGMPNFHTTNPYLLRKMEEWRKPGGHPCPDYFETYKKRSKMRRQNTEKV